MSSLSKIHVLEFLTTENVETKKSGSLLSRGGISVDSLREAHDAEEMPTEKQKTNNKGCQFLRFWDGRPAKSVLRTLIGSIGVRKTF